MLCRPSPEEGCSEPDFENAGRQTPYSTALRSTSEYEGRWITLRLDRMYQCPARCSDCQVMSQAKRPTINGWCDGCSAGSVSRSRSAPSRNSGISARAVSRRRVLAVRVATPGLAQGAHRFWTGVRRTQDVGRRANRRSAVSAEMRFDGSLQDVIAPLPDQRMHHVPQQFRPPQRVG